MSCQFTFKKSLKFLRIPKLLPFIATVVGKCFYFESDSSLESIGLIKNSNVKRIFGNNINNRKKKRKDKEIA